MSRRSIWMFLVAVVVSLGGCQTDTPYQATDDPQADADLPDEGPDVEEPDVEDPVEPPRLRVVMNEIACRGDEWVEIINLEAEPVSLEGWVLTDRPDDPERGFAFGEGAAIAAGAILTTPLESEEGLGFGISCDGEAISLLDPFRRRADTVDTGLPRIGATWGRLPDGTGDWSETKPTPGEPNEALGRVVLTLNEVSCRGDEFIEIINLGEDTVDLAGWSLSDAGGQSFALSGDLSAGDVALFEQQSRRRDGFTFAIDCGEDSVELISPELDVVSQVMAPTRPAAFTWGRLPDGEGDWSDTEPTPGEPNRAPIPTGGSFFDPLEVVTIDLTIAPEMIERLGEAPREYVPATFQVTDTGGQAEPFAIEARLKGRAGSFRPLDRKSAFKIKFNLEAGQRYRGLKKLTLNNMVQDTSMLHEWLAYSFFRGLGVPAPRVGYAFVRLNGEDYGLYSNIEALDEAFLDRHFLSTQHLYEGAYGQDLSRDQVGRLEIDEGDPLDRSDLELLVALLDDPPEEGFYAATQALIDWPQVQMTMAIEVYIGHWDGYAPSRNNFYLHTDAQGVLSLLPWGMDQTFRDHLPVNLEDRNRQGRLFSACLDDRACVDGYNDALIRITGFVEDLDAEAEVRALEAALQPWAERDPRRDYGMENIASAVTQTLEFLQQRQEDYDLYTECLRGPNPDPDGDGFACSADCDNDDPSVFPGAPEICLDLVDQDCNGRVDDGEDCPDCHERFLGPHRYLVCTTPRSWPEARAVCQEEGADLVSLNTPGEAQWMGEMARRVWPQSYWLGLDDREDEGEFVWVDGSPLTYESFWNGNEPNDYGDGEDCAQMLDNGRWNDFPCRNNSAVLCEAVCEPGQDEDGDGALRCGEDCNDGDPGIYPGAEEICRDGIDQDCSGVADDGDCISCEEVLRDGARYFFCNTRVAWEDARAECQALGGDLLVIQEAEEGTWANVQARQRLRSAYWVGLSDPQGDNTFEWVDGSALGFTNWHENEPNNPNEACGQVYEDTGLWNDLSCDAEFPFVCEVAR